MTETAPTSQQPTLWAKIWKDEQGRGKYVVFQFPNLSLSAWIVLTVVARLSSGRIASGASIIASVALLIWAASEVWSGVNYFRRGLGLVVISFTMLALIKNIIG